MLLNFGLYPIVVLSFNHDQVLFLSVHATDSPSYSHFLIVWVFFKPLTIMLATPLLQLLLIPGEEKRKIMNSGFSSKRPCQRPVKVFLLAAELHAGGDEPKTEFQGLVFSFSSLQDQRTSTLTVAGWTKARKCFFVLVWNYLIWEITNSEIPLKMCMEIL